MSARAERIRVHARVGDVERTPGGLRVRLVVSSLEATGLPAPGGVSSAAHPNIGPAPHAEQELRGDPAQEHEE